MASSTIARNIRCIRQSLWFYTCHRRLHHLTNVSHGLQPEVMCGIVQNYHPSSSSFSFSFYNRFRYLSVGTIDSKQVETPENGVAGEKSQVEKSEDKGAEEKSGSSEGKGEEKSGSSDQDGKAVGGSPVSWLSFFLLCLTAAGLLVYFDKKKKQYMQAMNEDADKNSTVKVEPSVGKAAVGGPFNLVNHHGISVTEIDFKGKWSLIYFGFTHCPDICPDELQKLASAIDKIKEKGIEVVPLFISVDPERDTVEQMRDYVKEFHPDIVGLTGSADDIKKVARSYRVYYMKTDDEDSDYLVDHSIVMYLMDPDMEFVKFFGKNEVVDTLAEGIIKEIAQHKK